MEPIPITMCTKPPPYHSLPLQCALTMSTIQWLSWGPNRRTARSHYNALSLCPRFNGSPGARIAVPLAPITMRSHVVQPRFKGSSGPEPESPYRSLHYNVNQVAVPLAPITQCALTTTTIQGLSWNPNCHTARSHYNTVSYEMAPLLDHKIPHALTHITMGSSGTSAILLVASLVIICLQPRAHKMAHSRRTHHRPWSSCVCS
jgi:hypothetical protein